MAVTDLQECKTTGFGGPRLAHDPEGVRHAARYGPKHTGATPGHAFQDLATANTVSMVEITHGELLSAAVPQQCWLAALELDLPKAGFIPRSPINRSEFSRVGR